MAGAKRTVEKVPDWVERLLIPTLGSTVRTIVEEVGYLEKTIHAGFEAVDSSSKPSTQDSKLWKRSSRVGLT